MEGGLYRRGRVGRRGKKGVRGEKERGIKHQHRYYVQFVL
jgi:hypothetical protein